MTTSAGSGRQSFKAVCYKCKYKTFDPPEDHTCPKCSFPMILRAQDQQSIRLNVREIFDRTSVEVGPKLPGLGGNGEPTGAAPAASQPMAQAPAMPMQMQMQPNPGYGQARRSRAQRISMALAFASAIAIGVAAAVVQSL